MPKLRVHNFAISVDGYAAGPGQNLENPLGVGGTRLHEWVFETRHGKAMIGMSGGEEGVDDDFFVAGEAGIGATIMGRNMFGPIRGPWAGSDWTGWWGDEPPYHHRVFVLTHHAHEPITMEGGTTFEFVTDGIEAARVRAFEAADGKDVRLGGGASAIQQYLRAGLIDEMHLAIVPILLGGGERLFDHLEGGLDGYECVELVSSPRVAHVRFCANRGIGASLSSGERRRIPRVRRASVADRPAVLATIIDAFEHDPVVRWFFPDNETYPARAEAFFGVLFDVRLAVNGVWVTDGGEAAALWSPPGPASLEWEDRAWDEVASELDADEIERCGQWDAAVTPHHPDTTHWYLGVLGTAHRFQGRGLGPAAAQPGIDAAERAGLPAFLETGVEQNVALYERMGFTVIGVIDTPDLPAGWCLRRDPTGTT